MITETLRTVMDTVPDREIQNQWIVSTYRKLHSGDLKGLAKQVNDAVNPVARKKIRQDKFNKDFQEAFDEEFRKLVPEIESDMYSGIYPSTIGDYIKKYSFNFTENIAQYEIIK